MSSSSVFFFFFFSRRNSKFKKLPKLEHSSLENLTLRPLRPTFNRQALCAVEQFSYYMKIPPKLKFIQSDRYDKQCEFS